MCKNKNEGMWSVSARRALLILLLAFCFSRLSQTPVAAGQRSAKIIPRGVAQTTGSPRSALLNINNVTMWASDNGMLERRPDFTAGVEFPKGTKTAVYAAGILWGGIVKDGAGQRLAVGGQTYHEGTQPGAIVRPGIVESQNNTDVRIYRIRRDWATADLTQDAADYYGETSIDVTQAQIDALRDQYRRDWQEWPWQKGAPYYERNGIPGYQPPSGDAYDPNADEPGLAGADQVIWFVANDLDQSLTTGLYGSLPIGIEMQVTCWAFANRPNLANVFYQRYRLVYKGRLTSSASSRIDSMYITKWVDSDIGEFSDDLVGCSPERNLGYAYNSNETDLEYSKSGLIPPSIGYALLQGPRVPSPGGTAHWNLQTIPGYENLPMTSFTYFTADSRSTDYDFGAIKGSQEFYNAMRGYAATPISPLRCMIDPTTGSCTKFELAGDPLAYTGWVDGRTDTAGDRRFALSSGPFTMALGDTQEVIYAFSGSLGSSNREAVREMEAVSGHAEDLYSFNFVPPDTLPVPQVRIVELDGHVILDWESDTAATRMIETYSSKGYSFETYDLYQLVSPTTPLSQAKAFAPFDVSKPRFLNLTTDLIRNKPLINGQKYYYAIAARFVNSDPTVANQRIESGAIVHTVTPHRPNPGVVYPYATGEVVGSSSSVMDYIGFNDASVNVSYFDPSKPDGHSYKVKFHRNPNLVVDIDEKPTWDLVDVSEIHTGFAGGDGVLLRSNNSGAAWNQLGFASPGVVRGIAMSDVLHATAVGDGGLLMMTTNGGNTWSSKTSGTSLDLQGVSIIDSSRIIAAGTGGIVVKTADGGTTWIPIQIDTVQFTGVAFFDALRGYVVGRHGRIWRSWDGGTSWGLDSSFTPSDLYAVSYPDLFTSYAVGANGTILREKSFNIHWVPLASGTTNDLLAISFIDAHTGTVVGSNGAILRTTDEGESWIPQSSGTMADLYAVSFSDSLNGVIAGAGGTMLRTVDGGRNWTAVSGSAGRDLFAVGLSSDSRIITGVRTDTPSRRVIGRGFSVQVSQAPYGLKGIFEVKKNNRDTRSNVYNVADPGGAYMFAGKGPSDLDTIRGGNASDADIELRFGGDSSWAIMRGPTAPTSRWLRVPYTVWGIGVAGKDSFAIRLYSVISEQGSDSIWRPQTLLNREYNGKTVKFFYPISIVNDSLRATDTSFYGIYYDDAPYRPDANVLRGYLWVNTQEQTNHANGIWKVYIGDLDEDGVAIPKGTTVRFERYKYITNRDEKLFQPSKVKNGDLDAEKSEIERINVFPNPYYGMNRAEVNKIQKFVTFSHLPAKATIRIFNLAGTIVKTLHKDDPTQFIDWDLQNESGLPVAGGLYLAVLELQDLAGRDLGTKTLKLMIVPEDQVHETN